MILILQLNWSITFQFMSIYLDLNGVIAWNGKTIIIFRKLNASDNQQEFVKKKKKKK